MKLTLHRIAFKETYTIGNLYINDVYECDTLEDKYRTPNEPKVDGATAIPFGRYQVILNYSPKFKRVMPLLLDVPGFSGIRIHSGNTDKDTSGCILVGKNKIKGKLIQSAPVYELIFRKFEQTKDRINWIEII
jgi:hypothetical protein